MTDTPPQKDICVTFSYSTTSEENQDVEALTKELRENGETMGTRMRVNDSVDAQSFLEGVLWFLQHPNTVNVGVGAISGVISGSVVLTLDRWLSKPDRRLEVEFEGTKITANSVDELSQILASLPPPRPKRILQDGEMMLDGKIMPFDEDLWKQHQDRWIQNLSKGNADNQDT
jgi:hypothetical protein